MTGTASAAAAASAAHRLAAKANAPLLTAATGAAVAARLVPSLRGAHRVGGGAVAAPHWRLLNLATFALSLCAARQPGRLDDDGSRDGGGDEKNGNREDVAALLAERDKTLVAPRGWAYAVWVPILAGELAMTVGSLVWLRDDGGTATGTTTSTAAAAAAAAAGRLLRTASAGFAAANVFQALWAASFRPKYIINKKKKGAAASLSPWISTLMLAGAAASLSLAHKAYTTATVVGGDGGESSIGADQYLLFFLPLSLHFGWTTAAALVSANGNIAMLCGNTDAVAAAAWLSAAAATVAGVAVTVTRNAPAYGGVVAWALAACAAGMEERVAERDEEISAASNVLWFFRRERDVEEIRRRKGYRGAAVQRWLCAVGAMVSGGAAIYTFLRNSNDVAP
jgi:hypothetical protein